MANYLNFRLERIIALDPARKHVTFILLSNTHCIFIYILFTIGPLVRPGNQNRLDTGDARSVQVIHTNAGYYGEGGRIGHIDFCVNGGRR